MILGFGFSLTFQTGEEVREHADVSVFTLLDTPFTEFLRISSQQWTVTAFPIRCRELLNDFLFKASDIISCSYVFTNLCTSCCNKRNCN